jgi:hypothetical protein
LVFFVCSKLKGSNEVKQSSYIQTNGKSKFLVKQTQENYMGKKSSFCFTISQNDIKHQEITKI